MRKLKMGYVGCGFLAQKVHIPNILDLDGCELVAVAEVRPQLGKTVQKRFGIRKLYRSHAEMAQSEEIEAVAVSGHFSGQGEIAIDLLKAGKDVFMEKPMATSVEQAERILDAERTSGKRLMIGYMKRYDTGNLRVKKLLDQFRTSGEMGPLRYVRNHGFGGDWTAGLDTPFDTTHEKYPASPTAWPAWMPERFRDGYLGYLQQYTHNVNLLRWFLDAGADVKVKAVQLDKQQGYAGVVVLEMGGVTTVIESGSVSYHTWDEHTQIYFAGGWVKTHAPPLLLRNACATVEVYRGNEDHKVLSHLLPSGGLKWSFKEEMRHFVECVKTGAPFRSPASDAIEDVRTLESIYRSHVESHSE